MKRTQEEIKAQTRKNMPGCLIVLGFVALILILIYLTNGITKKHNNNHLTHKADMELLQRDLIYTIAETDPVNVDIINNWEVSCEGMRKDFPELIPLINKSLNNYAKIDVYYNTGSRVVRLIDRNQGAKELVEDHTEKHVVKRSVFNVNPQKYINRVTEKVIK